MGCSFCLFDDFMTPYDVSAAPAQPHASSNIALHSRTPISAPSDIKTFLAQEESTVYKRVERNILPHALPLSSVQRAQPHHVIISLQAHIPPQHAFLFSIPCDTLKRLVSVAPTPHMIQ